MRYPSTFSALPGSLLHAWARKARNAGTQTALIIFMASLFPTGAHSESWDDMFKGMARDIIEEGKRAIQEGSDRSNKNNQQHQPYQQPQQQYQHQQPVQQPAKQHASNQSKAQIRDIQTRLQILGYDPGSADGVFGNKTAKAIAQFEIDQGMPVTGQPNTNIIAALHSAAGGIGQPSADTGDYSTSRHGSTQSGQYNGQVTTAPTGDFANATSAQECKQAFSECLRNAATNDLNETYLRQGICAEQNSACIDKLAAQSLTHDQILIEADRVKVDCENQTVHSTLYDCNCQSKQYIEYRGQHRGQYNSVLSDFYNSDLTRQCYRPQGAFSYAYKSCIQGFPLSSTGRRRTPVQQEEICRCQAGEFSNMQAGQLSTNSSYIQQARSQALAKCIR